MMDLIHEGKFEVFADPQSHNIEIHERKTGRGVGITGCACLEFYECACDANYYNMDKVCERFFN